MMVWNGFGMGGWMWLLMLASVAGFWLLIAWVEDLDGHLVQVVQPHTP